MDKTMKEDTPQVRGIALSVWKQKCVSTFELEEIYGGPTNKKFECTFRLYAPRNEATPGGESQRLNKSSENCEWIKIANVSARFAPYIASHLLSGESVKE
ncbi:hypothetical protein KM043_016859 [Ampulex compressa]|nr:hypothetical protein KM043_016859 [Ampulex compressa]